MCGSPEYKVLLWYASVCTLIFPVGLPLLCLIQLHRLRHLLDPKRRVSKLENVSFGEDVFGDVGNIGDGLGGGPGDPPELQELPYSR